MWPVRGQRLIVLLAAVAILEPVSALGAVELLLPQGCLPADAGPTVKLYLYAPEDPQCRGQVRARADVGKMTAATCRGASLFELGYRPGSADPNTWDNLEVHWQAAGRLQKVKARVRLCAHPAGRIKVRAEPDQLLAGRGQQASLTIEVSDSDGRPWQGSPPEVTCNVGRVVRLRRVGEGTYQATYLPPGDPFPQVAIIMAANPAGTHLDRIAVGRAVIPITAKVTLPGQTRPGTRMRMRVAGRDFGPVRADWQGRFELPILVPPGVNSGLATSIDAAGNRRTKRVNLYLPETNQLGLWAHPLHLPADGRSRARLLVTTVSARGRPADLGRVSISARQGRVSKLRRIARGLLEAYYTAPDRMRSVTDVISVVFPGGGSKSHAQAQVALLPGRAERLAVDAPPSLVAGSGSSEPMIIKVTDAQDNPVPGKWLRVMARKVQVGEVSEPEPGSYRVQLRAPARPERWRDDLQLEVADIPGAEAARLVIAPDSLAVTEQLAGRLTACLVDERGRPVVGKELVRRQPLPELHLRTDRFGCASFEVDGRKLEPFHPQPWQLGWAGSSKSRRVFLVREGDRVRLIPIVLDEQLPARKPLTRTIPLFLRPAARVELLLEARRQERNWLIGVRALDAQGGPAGQAQVTLGCSQGRLQALGQPAPGTWSWRLEPGPPGWRQIQVVATETGSGSAAVLTLQEANRSE